MYSNTERGSLNTTSTVTMFRNMVTLHSRDTIARMQRLLNNLDALLITNPTNIRYLTGFTGAAPEEREAYCLVTQDKLFLFTNALYREKVIPLTRKPGGLKRLNLLASKGLTFIETSREEPFATKLAEILKKTKCIRLGFEENNLTVAELGKLDKELTGITLIPTQSKIEDVRMIKRNDEIVDIRAAAKLTDQCFDFILGKIKIGVTETDIAWEIESFIRTHGASLAFSPIVAFGKNSSMPHYQPVDSCKLTADSLILLDFGARVNGYCSDMTRMVFIGKPKDEWRRAYQTVLSAQQAALNYLIGPGPVTHAQGRALNSQLLGGEADSIARGVIGKAGFSPYPHSLGHGVGLDIHEAPRLTMKKDEVLKPGMVVTFEPGVYIESQYGIRIEDLILLKNDSIEILSKSPKEIIVL